MGPPSVGPPSHCALDVEVTVPGALTPVSGESVRSHFGSCLYRTALLRDSVEVMRDELREKNGRGFS